MARAGADILIPHMGLTTKGAIGAHTAVSLDEAAKRVQAMHDAARRVNKNVLVLCHGGLLSEPASAHIIVDQLRGIVGVLGARPLLRIPPAPAPTHHAPPFPQFPLSPPSAL